MLDINKPIPQNILPNSNVTVKPIDEIMVDLADIDSSLIVCEPRYYLLGIKGAMPCCMVRQQVAELLLKATKQLPNGYKFKVFDSWRPYVVQESLYWNYYNLIKGQYADKNLSNDQIRKKITMFVSPPSKNPLSPSVHSTGGAIDLTIINKKGVELNMGSSFDDFSVKAYTNYFEETDQEEIITNRRLLYNTMISVGFTNLPSEWWHYDYGNCFWGFYKNKESFYAGIYEYPVDIE